MQESADKRDDEEMDSEADRQRVRKRGEGERERERERERREKEERTDSRADKSRRDKAQTLKASGSRPLQAGGMTDSSCSGQGSGIRGQVPPGR